MSAAHFLSLFEKVALRGSYHKGIYQRLVAAAYAMAPKSEPRALPLYQMLIQKVQRQYQMLGSKYQFKMGVSNYPSQQAMSQDLDAQRAQGRKPTLDVSITSPEQAHPAIPAKDNDMLRAVHDIIAHHYGQHEFSGRGEFGAYMRHLKTLPPAVAPVLFTEIVGQTCAYYVYEGFQEQKAVILDDFDFIDVGFLCPKSPLNRAFTVVQKVLQPIPGFRWERFAQGFPGYAQALARQPGFNPQEWDTYSPGNDPSVLPTSAVQPN